MGWVGGGCWIVIGGGVNMLLFRDCYKKVVTSPVSYVDLGFGTLCGIGRCAVLCYAVL